MRGRAPQLALMLHRLATVAETGRFRRVDAWRENTYTSLSMVARAITGTNWNGYRFFGLETGRSRSQMTRHRRAERPVGKVSGARRSTAASDAAISTKAPQ